MKPINTSHHNPESILVRDHYRFEESDKVQNKSTNGENIGELLRKKFQIGEKDVKTIMLNMINRERFNYSTKDILEYLLKCICFRR